MHVKIIMDENIFEFERRINEYLEKVSNTNFVDIKYLMDSDWDNKAMIITRTEVE